MPNNILIIPGSASIQFSGSEANTIRLQVEPSGSVAFYGKSGSMFSFIDNTSTPFVSFSSIASVQSAFEKVTVSSSSATGTINYNIISQSVLFYTASATGNWTINVRGNSTTTLNNILDVGQSVSFVFLATNSSPAFYQTGFQIDNVSVSPRWQGGVAPTSGNPNSIDAYAFVLTKLTSTPTYLVLASQTRYA